MTIKITIIDFKNAKHRHDLVFLLDSYASDPMGGGEPLAVEKKAQLTDELAKLPHYIGFIAYDGDTPVALANCFMGFSTFACRPLINIHDFVVVDEFRGKGVSQQLMASIAEKAKSLDCCKITLEVLSGNQIAINAYEKFGFSLYQLDESAGTAQFMECKL